MGTVPSLAEGGCVAGGGGAARQLFLPVVLDTFFVFVCVRRGREYG